MSIFMYLNVKSILIELLIINAICSAILVIISKNPVISVIFLISLILNSALFLMVKGMPFLGISYILIYLGAIIVLFLFVIMMINVRLTDILETGSQYTKNIPLALTVSGLFLYEFLNVLPAAQAMNSSVLFIEDSILISLSKQIVLFLNSLFSEALNNFPDFKTGLSAGLESIEELSNGRQTSYFAIPLISNLNWPETLINSYTQIISVAYSLYTYGAFLFLILGIILLLAMIAPIYISRR